ncbi:LuxR C-terminal-related transcriptional regulator [Isoptericola sp. NPDC057391]|uniref:LuxR C-terminal-related transcriptional regulator n=1 Tax=Isoptericola sp. NPDC057391 TaxID=3346117 RepID=UPI003632D2EB
MEREHGPGAPPDVEVMAPGGPTMRSKVSPSKLRPAPNPQYLVHRPRLVRLLDTAVRAPLTLVVAPAGSGKTSLVRDWLGRAGLPHAWLSVDEADRDPVQLWRGILAALEGIAPDCSEFAARALRQQRTPADAVAALVDDLEGRPYDERVLVIDDLELVGDEAVAASLSEFVRLLPRWLHVVLVSRRTPRLPVDRLRARGLLGEIHFAQLRFSDDEAAEMLGRLAPGMPADEVGELARRAGGWAASIQLAALAARAAEASPAPEAPRHGVGGRYVEDYVWHEVLRGEEPDVVEVLTSAAVVDRVAPRLAQVLAGREDAPALLARAEEHDLFTARIEPSGSYEIHALVREALVAVERRRSPQHLAQLHRTAARWFSDDGQPVLALEHLLTAGDHRDALRLLASCASDLYESGRAATVLRTLAEVPDDVCAADLTATIDAAWCRLFVDRARFVRDVDALVPWSSGEGPDVGAGADPTERARLDVLQAVVASVRGQWADGARLARSALATIGDAWHVDPVVRYGWNLVAREIALSERWDDSSAEVRKLAISISAAPEGRLALEGTRALGAALGGRPVDALRLVAGARHASEQSSMTMLRAELLTAEGIANREIGDRAAALPALVQLAGSDCEPLPHCRLLACLELSRSWLDQGDTEAAQQAFDRAGAIVDAEVTGPGGRTLLARTGVLMALSAGRTDEARRWVAQIDDPFWSGIKTARVLIAEGDPAGVAGLLEDLEPRCVRHHVVRDLLRSRASTDPAEAHALLLGAVELASAHGLVHSVAAEGPEIVEAVERLAWRVPQPWLARLRRVPLDGRAPTTVPAAELARGLTDRQVGILRMLPSRLTLREIADELYISVNTLKFHLKIIYRELGCGSRAEAADVARALVSPRRPDPHGHPSSTRRR